MTKKSSVYYFLLVKNIILTSQRIRIWQKVNIKLEHINLQKTKLSTVSISTVYYRYSTPIVLSRLVPTT